MLKALSKTPLKNMFKTLALTALLASNAVHADVNVGVAHYARGEYDKAAKVIIPLAETADNGMAQYFLGVMYARGQGVEQSDELAAKWYRAAAEKGVASAQQKLGQFYRDGKGVAADLEQAYAWFSVAAHLGNKYAPEAIAVVEPKMSPQELGEAKKLSTEYIAKYGKKAEEKPAGIDKPIQMGGDTSAGFSPDAPADATAGGAPAADFTPPPAPSP